MPARIIIVVSFLTLILAGITGSPVAAQDDLKGIGSVCVLVEALPEGANAVGLTTEMIQTDVELKLRLAGMRIVNQQECSQLPGRPHLHVALNLTKDAKTVHIEVELIQDARLERNSVFVPAVVTWSVGVLGTSAAPSSQNIRDGIKDLVDRFLNAWLSVNPKK